MIRVEGLTKVFPNPDGSEKTAVDDVSFGIQPGEIYGLLGPNGAGKTTTLRMISGLLRPTAGHVFIDNTEVTDRPNWVKQRIGYLTANTGLYVRLTPIEMLKYFATLYNIPRAPAKARIAELVEWLGMSDFLKLRCGALSTGQKQRVSIARALIANPPILVLDEPTLGLDVLTNRVILDFIRQERTRGKAILLSTHHLDEAETLCDCIGLMHHGRLVAEGDMPALHAQAPDAHSLSEVFLHLIDGHAAK
ncbi:MAG: ATP-binding cassette domain-containing protein [Planctomycetes bacterium]|nr:ATP-binding cassette domain-containing protein [Planctomycetota bacterium]